MKPPSAVGAIAGSNLILYPKLLFFFENPIHLYSKFLKEIQYQKKYKTNEKNIYKSSKYLTKLNVQ